MGTRRVETVTVTQQPIPDAESVAPDAENDAIDDAPDDVIAGLIALGGAVEGGVRWQVTRIKPIDKAGYCGTIRDEISLERMQEEYGGGSYRVRAIDARGRVVTGSSRELDIQEKTKSAQLAVVQAPQSPLADPIVQLMLQQARESAAMLQGILAKAFERPQPAIADPLDMLVKLKALLPEPPKSDSALDMFLKGLEFGRDSSGGGETSMMDLIGQGIKHVGPLISAGVQQRAETLPQSIPVRQIPQTASVQQIEQAAPAQRAVREVSSQSQENPPEQAPMMKLLNWLRQQTNALVYQAARNSDPRLYAAVFLDNLPDFVPEQMMYERLKAPDAVVQLSQINAAVLQHQTWFEIFREHVVEAMEREQNSASESSPTSSSK